MTPHEIPNPQLIGALIAEYRREQGLSQEALAARAGLDRAYIGLIERGERNPTIQATWRILTDLGLQVAQGRG